MKRLSILLSFLLAGLVGIGQQTNVVPLDVRVKKGTLPNGLTYYIMPNKKPENKVELRLVVNAGSVLETDEQQGLAHFCEHMAFNGSKNFKKNELVDYLQTAGVKFGAHLNAYTSFDETVYMLGLPSGDKVVLEKGFQILEDWAQYLLFDSEEIEKERGVVLEEYRLGLGAQKRMMTEYLPKVLYKSQYAERLPIGKKEVLETFKRDAITSFYRDWYRPNLMAVIVVGDIDVATAEAKILAHFSSLKNPENAPKRPVIEVPDHAETFVTVVTDREATYGTVQLAFKVDGIYTPNNTTGSFIDRLKQELFYSMLNDRLRELSKKPEAAFTTAWVYQDELWVRSKEALQAFAIVSGGKYNEALDQITRELARVREFGFTESELKRAKINLRVELEGAIKEADKSESRSYAGQLVQHFLTMAPMPSAQWTLDQFQKNIEGTNLAELNHTLRRLMSETNRVVTITGPEADRVKMPSEDVVLQTLQAALNDQPTPYDELSLPESLMDLKPKAGTVTKSDFNKPFNSYVITLSNGVRVLYMPTTLKNDEILFNAISKGGTNLLGPDEFMAVTYGLGAISQTGVGQFSNTDLEKVLAGKSVSVSPYIGSTSEGFYGNCRPKDIESLMQLLHLYFTQPRSDPEAFQSYVNRQRSFYDNIEANPSSYYSVEWGRWLHNNHERAFKVPGDQEWAATDYSRIEQVYQERFANPADFSFVFVGNLDPKTFNTLAANYLGSLPTSNNMEETIDIGYDVRPGSDRLEVRKGTEPKSQVQIVYHQDVPYSKLDDLTLDIAADILTIKLIEVLREEMGGVYGTSARNSFSRLPKSGYSFTIGFPCGPDNVDTLIDAALKELKKLADSGPTQKDLDKVKQTLIEELNTDVQSNRFWMSRMIELAYYGDALSTKEAMITQVKSITVAQIQAAVNKYLQGDYLIGVLYPE